MVKSNYYNNFKRAGALLVLITLGLARAMAADKPPSKSEAHAAVVQPHPGGPGAPHPMGFHADAAHPAGFHADAARPHYAFHEHDVHRFSHDDLVRWRGGRWNRTCFGGRCGWWWFAGDQWYFYDTPVYPYPLVVSTVAYVEPVAVASPAPVVAVAPPPMAVAAPPKIWYYCDNPAGYYPTIPTCNTQFRQVSAPPSH